MEYNKKFFTKENLQDILKTLATVPVATLSSPGEK